MRTWKKTVTHDGLYVMMKMGGNRWDEILDELTESLKETLVNINRQDLAKFCLENKTTRNAAECFLKAYKKSNVKDSSYAAEAKEKGNEEYRKKNYQESLDLYTKSIFHAKKEDECLPLAYSNRSLVLQQMGRPSESLVDMDMALETGYPKEDMLVLRKAKCLVQLGDTEKARDVLMKGLKNSKKNEFYHLIQKELEKIKNVKSKNSTEEPKLPKVAGGENKDFVSASEYLSVSYDQTKGRHVLATQDIEVGDVLFVEKPFAFVLLENGCHNCCKDIHAPIPCWNCLDVSYCSPKCRDDFWKSVHSFECGFAKLFKSVGIAHLSVRIILKASSSLDELKKVLEKVSSPEYKSGTVSYKSNGYDSIYNLVHNSDKYEISDLFQYFMTASLLALYLKNCTNYFPAASGDEDLRLVTSVICRHILQLICNGHAITGIRLKGRPHESVLSAAELRIGTSIYPSASMMNHSCEPSIMNSFHGNFLIVRAARRIRKGEEVFNCYGPHARRMNRAGRQEILSKQYHFNCKCQACVKKFDIQDRFTAFKCTNCKGPSVPDEDNSENTICLDCGKTGDVSAELSAKRSLFYSLIEEGESLLEDDDVLLALKTFLESWRLGREIFYAFHKDLSYAADEVGRCLATLGEFRKCVLFLKCSVRSIEERFGSCSVEVAEEMKKLADIITNYSVKSEKSAVRDLAREGVAYYQKAEKIIKLFYGPEVKILEEIKANEKILQRMLESS